MTDAELLERYRPFCHYDQIESFRADSAAVLPEHFFDGGRSWSYSNALKRSGGKTIAKAKPEPGQPKLELAFLGRSSYAHGEAVRGSDFIDAFGRDYINDATRMHANPQYADRSYGHVARETDGTRWLQYWFFYYYNDKNFLGVGVHEGDWEMIQLRIGADDKPTVATYAQHNDAEGLRYADVTRKKVGPTEVPVVFVGRGSHASFAKPGRHDVIFLFPDYADGKGAKVRPALEVIDETTSWVAWPGKWGSSESSPRGPAQHRQWADPAGFHREVAGAAVRSRARARASAPAAPPAPAMTARVVAGRALVEYRFPERLPADSSMPTRIAISVDRLDDDMPPVTHAFPVKGREGTAAHPLPLESGSYAVRVVAFSEEGAASPVVSRRIESG